MAARRKHGRRGAARRPSAQTADPALGSERVFVEKVLQRLFPNVPSGQEKKEPQTLAIQTPPKKVTSEKARRKPVQPLTDAGSETLTTRRLYTAPGPPEGYVPRWTEPSSCRSPEKVSSGDDTEDEDPHDQPKRRRIRKHKSRKKLKNPNNVLVEQAELEKQQHLLQEKSQRQYTDGPTISKNKKRKLKKKQQIKRKKAAGLVTKAAGINFMYQPEESSSEGTDAGKVSVEDLTLAGEEDIQYTREEVGADAGEEEDSAGDSKEAPTPAREEDGAEDSEEALTPAGEEAGAEDSEEAPAPAREEAGAEDSEEALTPAGKEAGAEDSEEAPTAAGEEAGAEDSEEAPTAAGEEEGLDAGEEHGPETREQASTPAGEEKGAEDSEGAPTPAREEEGAEDSEEAPIPAGEEEGLDAGEEHGPETREQVPTPAGDEEGADTSEGAPILAGEEDIQDTEEDGVDASEEDDEITNEKAESILNFLKSTQKMYFHDGVCRDAASAVLAGATEELLGRLASHTMLPSDVSVLHHMKTLLLLQDTESLKRALAVFPEHCSMPPDHARVISAFFSYWITHVLPEKSSE
ncbi:glutamate-rich protein 1 isoform X3 [Saimiri boliviensis]|uniref:glutamate-rich protein 1 isoform X3 n=1 Tax=Saimiri boliviensis TaxID=27679 RepID=UPI003D779895